MIARRDQISPASCSAIRLCLFLPAVRGGQSPAWSRLQAGLVVMAHALATASRPTAARCGRLLLDDAECVDRSFAA